MKLWLVSRTDKISYDEYDSMVVAAIGPEGVEAVAKCLRQGGRRVKLVASKKEAV